ncbi:MAG: diphthine synthase [Candidatus Pacearchaeota archaeon]
MLYLIGLGLNEKSISLEGLEACRKADEVFLEGYTIDFPYKKEELEKVIENKIKVLKRDEVESEGVVKEAEKKDICLLIYGSPLFATTHISLLQMCIEKKIKYRVIFNASVFDAIAETGLQLYKFGKTTSLPKWTEKHKPASFVDVIKENQSIRAHTLLLVDIGLEFQEALNQLIEACKDRINLKEMVICSNLGTEKAKILYGSIEKLKNKKIEKPFCFIILGEMHFLEREFLNNFLVR